MSATQSDPKGSPFKKWIGTCVAAVAIVTSASVANAATVSGVDQAVNIFTSGTVTGGMPVVVDVKGPTPISSGVEFPFFAFGTYDIDATANSLTMTLVADLANLQITNYDASTVDRYYFEFERQITAASISGATAGFAATVDIIAPGTALDGIDLFGLNLPTSFTFGNGGILVSIGAGTDLETVGTGGSLTVDLAAVPLPASLPLLLVGMAGLGLARRRS